MAHDNFFCSFCCSLIDGKHLVRNSQQSVKRRLDGVPAVDRNVAVQYLLKHLCVRDENFMVADQLLQQTSRISLMRMRCADQVHGNIRIHESHDCGPPVYPLSISKSMESISPVGKS